ncbi:MAG TPA: DNA alkylation repair protein [Candidatus Binataceae bacterium]
MSSALVRFVTTQLKSAADPAKAPAMAAYMKTKQPFYGVPTPERAEIMRKTRDRFAPPDQLAYEQGVMALWRLPHREERYAAIAYARQHPRFIAPASMPVYERIIREGAWWDFVDETAANLVGMVLLKHRGATRPVLDRWIDDKDMWIRRTALIAHLHHKEQTDADQLFDHCLRRAHEKEFFIRKAIGWGLREYSKTDPKRVRFFLNRNRARLSPLSFSEGSKVLERGGMMGADAR